MKCYDLYHKYKTHDVIMTCTLLVLIIIRGIFLLLLCFVQYQFWFHVPGMRVIILKITTRNSTVAIFLAHLHVEVTSLRAPPLGVRGPENTNLLTSFPVAVSLFYI